MSAFEAKSERARAAREALIGRVVAGRYVLRALIGHGGMGAVYEAEPLGLRQRVAIKFVDPEYAADERVIARFAREARAMSAIESAHIVSVIDAGAEDGRPFLVMELLRGEDLGQRLARTRRIPYADAMHIVAQVLKGLARAHAAGIIHRDLKPDNVFLVKTDADPCFAKIVDFGVSKIARPRDKTTPLALTGRGTVLGTPYYMAPEQAQASPNVDGRADLFSVGAILFECLSGRPPFTGESYEQVILAICTRDAPDLRAIDPSYPAPVAEFVARALARDPAQRFTSAERMLAALHVVAPEEKLRVPLEPGPAHTLLSAGVAAAGPAGAKTRLGIAPLPLLPTPVQASAPVPSPLPAPPLVPRDMAVASRDGSDVRRAPGSVGSRARSAAIVITALVATLTGIAVTTVAIRALEKKSADTRASAPVSVDSRAPGASESTTAPASAKQSASRPGAPKSNNQRNLP